MRIQITPARLLNDQRGIFGLWMTDFAGAIVLFVIVSTGLEGTRFAITALPAAILFLGVLSPIRLTTRRKIVRDTVSYFLTPKKLSKIRGRDVRS